MSNYSITVPQSQPDGTLVRAKLRGDNIVALLRQAGESGKLPTRVRREPTPRPKHCRIREAHRVAVLRQLADSLQAEMPLPESLRLIAHETHDPIAKKEVRKLLEEIQSGALFSEAARQAPALFSETEIALIESGERGSALDEVFLELAEVSETTLRMAKQVGGPFIYPGVISVFGSLGLLYLSLFIVPRFADLQREMGVKEMPIATELIIYLGSLFVRAFFPLCISGGVFLLLFLILRRTWAGRLSFEFWKLRLPLMNHIFFRMAVARGCGLMSILTRHAVPLTDALRLAGRSCGNRAMQRGFEGAGIAIADGETLARSLEASEVFPEFVVWRVALAEATGDVSATFLQLSKHFAEQVESRMRLLIAILEPALILILGGAFAFTIISMFLPLVSLISFISGGG